MVKYVVVAISTLVLGALLLGASCGSPVVLVVMGDTQSWAGDQIVWYPDGRAEFPLGTSSIDTWILTNQALCAQKDAKRIKGVVYVGDVVDTAGVPAQWQRAAEALDVLDACGLPYYLIPGNHDHVNGDWSAYLDFFASRPTQPGAIGPSGLTHLTDLGQNWFLLGTRHPWMTAADEAWYDATIAAYPNARVLVTNHDFIDRTDMVFNDPAAEAFVDARPEIRFAAYGHFCCNRSRRRFHETFVPSGRSVVSLYNNDQYNTTLHGWTTWVELRGDRVCMEAWHPVMDQRGYDAIPSTNPNAAGQTGRAASPARTCIMFPSG